MLGFKWRCDLSQWSIKLLYISFVRSHLEYCSPVWNPYYRVDCDLLERVQKKFLRLIEFKLNRTHHQGDYTWICSYLNINSLEDRRCMSDICFLHGLINGNIDNSLLLSKLTFLIPAANSRITRSSVTFRISVSSTNKTKNHPILRMMETANHLNKYNDFVLFNSGKHEFKGKLRRLFPTQFLV